MTDRHSKDERLGRLVSQLVDGNLSREELDELETLVQSDLLASEAVVDHLLLDSLLSEDLNSDALTALVDLAAGNQPTGAAPTSETPSPPRKIPTASTAGRPAADWYWRSATWVLAGAALVLAVVMIAGRMEKQAFADPTRLVQAALRAHAEPVEREYAVDVEWDDPSTMQLPKDVRVATLGDRFWVEIRARRRFSFGRETNGTIWVALGRWRGMRIAPREVGPLLETLAEIYSLNLESLLREVLEGHQLERTATGGATHIINATPKAGNHGWVRAVTIEVDQETKAVRRLTIRRRGIRAGFSTITFTLVDARSPDESRYQLEGHLREPYRVLSRDSQPDRRLAVLENWIGPLAKGWIIKDQQRSD